MLIKFVIENVYSFGQRREFSLIPNTRLKTLSHHNYHFRDFSILKLASIYGANGAGKSNLISALKLMQDFVVEEELFSILRNKQFKLTRSSGNKKQVFKVEFLQDNIRFHYGFEITNKYVALEELRIISSKRNDDIIIYERKTNNEGTTKIKFSEAFENDEKGKVLKEVLLQDFVKPDELILKLLANRDNEFLQAAKKAFTWFDDTLEIITPQSHTIAMVKRLEKDSNFKSYVQNIMCSFDIGISSIASEKKPIKEFFGEENYNEIDRLIKNVEESSRKMIRLMSPRGEELLVVKENNNFFVERLQLVHSSKNGIKRPFNLDEESDGTIRLLDLIPAFRNLISMQKVYLIDEIERSIHPLLIKNLIQKFSLDKGSKGQLVFTTHESNLLDQDLFRQDEIWFAEKDNFGVTDLYSLINYKEHKTIDIRKGYLTGRYGSIPFLENFESLNLHDFDT